MKVKGLKFMYNQLKPLNGKCDENKGGAANKVNQPSYHLIELGFDF